jgi:acyl transferase domain-containing protein
MLTSLGRMWASGVSIDWRSFHAGEPRNRVVLPTYPFERKRFYISKTKTSDQVVTAKGQMSDGLTHGNLGATLERSVVGPSEDESNVKLAEVPPQKEVTAERFASDAAATVAGFFRDMLGLDRVSPSDDFFELGGHSLLGTQLLARIRSTFGVDIPIRHLFESRTVAGLAQAVEAQLASAQPGQATASASIPRVSRKGRSACAGDTAAADAPLHGVAR